MTPDYPSSQVPTWTETFTLEPSDLDNLYQTLTAQGLWTQTWKGQDNPPVGGSSDSLSARANGRTFGIPAYVVSGQEKQVQVIYAAVQALVPPAVMQKLDARRAQYVQEHSKP